MMRSTLPHLILGPIERRRSRSARTAYSAPGRGRRAGLLSLAVVAALLAGCSATPPAPALLDLASAPLPAPATQAHRAAGASSGAAAANALPWRIAEPLSLPAALDREAVMVSPAPGQLQPWQDLRWSEPLQDAVPRLLAADLSALRPAPVWRNRALGPAPGPVRTLRLEINQWEAAQAAAELRLQARWSLSGPAASDPVQRGQIQLTQPWSAATPGALVAAQRALLWRLAEALAQQTSDAANAPR